MSPTTRRGRCSTWYLVGARAYRVLLGACDPMACPIHVFRPMGPAKPRNGNAGGAGTNRSTASHSELRSAGRVGITSGSAIIYDEASEPPRPSHAHVNHVGHHGVPDRAVGEAAPGGDGNGGRAIEAALAALDGSSGTDCADKVPTDGAGETLSLGTVASGGALSDAQLLGRADGLSADPAGTLRRRHDAAGSVGGARGHAPRSEHDAAITPNHQAAGLLSAKSTNKSTLPQQVSPFNASASEVDLLHSNVINHRGIESMGTDRISMFKVGRSAGQSATITDTGEGGHQDDSGVQ